MESEKLVKPTPRILIETLQALPEEVQDTPIGCHSMGNGIDIRNYGHGVELVGFNVDLADTIPGGETRN